MRKVNDRKDDKNLFQNGSKLGQKSNNKNGI